MERRLQWIVKRPAQWIHWAPLRGGSGIQRVLERRYPQSESYLVESTPALQGAAAQRLCNPWWSPVRWGRRQPHPGMQAEPVQMLWANMALHASADPEALIAQWHRLVATDGFLMFSCLGPDTLRELRALYQQAGYPPAAHDFTDMHDWGDMLVHAGFAEPVMDMERITLSFSSARTLLLELRGLGRNFHTGRFCGLRGRAWHTRLQELLQQGLALPQAGGRLQVSFEIVYGHAFKPPARIPVAAQTSIPLDAMRERLQRGNTPLG